MYFNNNSNEKCKLESLICNICKLRYKYFLNKINVIGIGCGYKVRQGFYTNQLCIQVLVCKKLPKNQLLTKDIISSNFKGIPTDVIETGFITLDSLIEKIRPVKGGYCISGDLVNNSGTAGCLVTNGVLKFILSVNHVLAKGNQLPIGYPIVQPSYKYHGSAPQDIISTLHRYVPLRFMQGEEIPVNLSDSAIALLLNKAIFSNEIAFIGKLNAVKSPILNKHVKKVGSSSELTEGTITSVGTTFIVHNPDGSQCFFIDQILTTRMSELGDSGAILVNDSNCGVGLSLGHGNNVSAYSRLSVVLDQLDVHLVT